MYEFDPRMQQNGLGVWGWAAPAVGVAATGYALYRANRAQRRQQAQAAGRIETPLQRQCRENMGAPCTDAQINDICNNLSYSRLNSEFPECIRRVTARHLYELDAGRQMTTEEIGERCEFESASARPRDCAMYITMRQEAQRSRGAAALIAQAQQQPQDYGVKGMDGLGFSRVPERPVCGEIPEGEQFCFRTTTVDESPPEQRFARNQGCLPLSSGARCETSPYGSPGLKWCCPPGWPREPGADPIQPGEFPPSPPGLMNKVQFFGQYWWFWALAAGVPTVAYLGYRYLKDEGYIGAPIYETYDFSEYEVGAR